MADPSNNDRKPWLKPPWVIPPKASGHFVAAMEDVLDVYARPPDPGRPVVCVDEGGKQLIGDVRPPLPVRAGTPAREDSEYARGGMANLLLAVEPLTGRRLVAAADFARRPTSPGSCGGCWRSCARPPGGWCW